MPTFVIAEAGVNHSGRLDHALALIAAAKAAGADAVKFQAFTPSVLAPLDWENRAMLKGLALTREELTMCAAEARHKGIEFFLTAMDSEWLSFSTSLNVKRFKIGSGQNRDKDFVQAVGILAESRGQPVIMSNGMADNLEFNTAVAWLLDVMPEKDVTLLSCVSKYPTPDVDMSMSGMEHLRDLWPNVGVGLSSHCRSFWPCVAAAYAGAAVIEAHLALDGTTGVDVPSSLLPGEFAAMIREIRACTP